MELSLVFKVSVKVHHNYWNMKCRIYKAKVYSYVIMHKFFKTETSKTGRGEYEGVGVEVGQ